MIIVYVPTQAVIGCAVFTKIINVHNKIMVQTAHVRRATFVQHIHTEHIGGACMGTMSKLLDSILNGFKFISLERKKKQTVKGFGS